MRSTVLSHITVYRDFDIVFWGHSGPNGGVIYDNQYILSSDDGPLGRIRTYTDFILEDGGGQFDSNSFNSAGTIQTGLEMTDFAAGYLEDTRSVIGSNGKLYTPTVKGNVFPGNQNVIVYKIGKIAKTVGRGTAIVSGAITISQASLDIRDGNMVKAGARLLYGSLTIGVGFIPVVGPFFSLGMGVIDAYYGEVMYQWCEDNFTY